MKITLLKGLLLVGALLSFGLVQAQDVSGNVSDANGPLPGASVVVQGTTNGTQSDFDGNYTLSDVASDATLVFSYIGYSTVEVPVNGQSTINIVLEEDAEALEEVVIIGYGTTTVKDATGAVTAVSAEDFNGGVIASPEQLIQGKTAGVNIQQSSGEPGAGISINIRGSSSVRANNNPLFVVDGIPLSGESTSPGGDAGLGGSAVRNPLNFLNPQDIESISILKDASATAIYGSRGANGVVIITTKSGRSRTAGNWDFASSLSISTPANEYDLLSPSEFLAGVSQFGGDPSAVDFGANTNWQDFITRTTASQNQNLSFSKNYGDGNVRATFGYATQYGVIEKTDLERITGRLNIQHRFFDDKLLVGLQSSISRVNDETAPLTGGAGFRGDILGASYSANPTWPLDPDFAPGGSLVHPQNLLLNSQNRTTTDRVLVNGSAEYSITSELKGKVNVGYDLSEGENTSVLNSDINGLTGFDQGFGVYNTLERESYLLEGTLTYNKDIGDDKLDVLVGYSFQDFRTKGRNAAGRGFGGADLDQMGRDLRSTVNRAGNTISGRYQQYYYGVNTTNLIVNRLLPSVVAGEAAGNDFVRKVQGLTADTFDNTDELQSFFARVNYNLKDKYLFTGTVRADGSSRFGPDNQYGVFPSGAFAWKLSEEDFVGENVSTLKLRLSAGLVGNQDGLGYGNFVARQRFGGLGIQNDNVVNQNGLVIVATDRPDLKWEETLNFNVGFDFGFNLDRLSGSIDVYRSETNDQLLRLPPAAPAVDPFQFGNFDAAIQNVGIEFALAYDFIQTENSTFSAAFNIAYNENEVQDFDGAINTGAVNGQGLSGAFAQRLESGRSIFSYYMAIFEGFDSDGFPIYQDVDGNGTGDPIGDQTFVGEDALPDVTAGLSLNYSINNWDVSAYLNGQFGFSVYNNTANGLFTSGSITNARNVTPNVLTSGEGAGASADVSTRFLEKGDFVRLQNATIGYNVPLSSDGFLTALRLSVTGQNLFLITDYSGLDPEITVATGDLGSGVPSRGIDWSGFPNPRTITFGLNASF
ncbi:MAG: SusC/RagA family TonB-linked outer membrane protein [Eudoraea sp.]|nr:SusC/RagA family TonB-linked outer membrane protein [Eudoraea sp.]